MASPRTVRRRRALLTRAKAVLRERYREFDLSLDDVAQAVGSSRRQLQRVFRESEGVDFRTHLLRLRMERAHVLLSRQRRPLSVRAAAPLVGYRQAGGLRQAFKRYFGIVPSAVQAKPLDFDDLWRRAEEASSREPAAEAPEGRA